MPLALSLPADRVAPPKDLETRPKQVKAWIESLPLAQSMDASRRLCVHLAGLNRAKIDVDTRLQILEVYRPTAATALEELDAIYAKSALPLGPRAREALVLARDLSLELATGYKIALVERGGKLLGFGAKKQLPQLVARAMEYLTLCLRTSYKSYTPVPAGVWRDLHQLYLHAEQEGVHKDVVEAETKLSVNDLYCEALLVSLTDPYRLVQGECDKIMAQARAYRGTLGLWKERPATRSSAHFIVPCDTDKPPKPALSTNDDTGGPNWRMLDANAVVDKLRAKKQAAETGQVSATMSKALGPEGLALLARLIILWGDPPKRSARRNPAESTVAICVGLKAVGHFVSFEPRVDPAAEADALRKGITMPLMALPTDDASQAIPVFEWDVVNESTGGLKVRRMGATQQPIGVGEVVGVKLMNRSRWTIGVARWITMFDEGGMEFGIQFLGTMARPVWVQPTITTSPQAKLGLWLAFGDGADEADSLLTPPNTFADMREFELDHEGQVSCVRATSLIEKTGRFELFHVSSS
jgi:cyclic-di-GMP-binding protein